MNNHVAWPLWLKKKHQVHVGEKNTLKGNDTLNSVGEKKCHTTLSGLAWQLGQNMVGNMVNQPAQLGKIGIVVY